MSDPKQVYEAPKLVEVGSLEEMTLGERTRRVHRQGLPDAYAGE